MCSHPSHSLPMKCELMYSHFVCESLDASSADNNPIETLMISSSISSQGDHSLLRCRPNIPTGSTGLSSISSTTLLSPVQINTCHSLLCNCQALLSQPTVCNATCCRQHHTKPTAASRKACNILLMWLSPNAAISCHLSPWDKRCSAAVTGAGSR
jgi:hypothetical protein